MSKSSTRGVFLSLILLSSMVALSLSINAYAETMVITSSSSSVNPTTIPSSSSSVNPATVPPAKTIAPEPVNTKSAEPPSAVPPEPPSTGSVETIRAKSHSFEETSIIEFTNDGKKDASSFRIWLSSGFNFKSFKTESGWTGEKTPQGVIILTSSESVKPGESIKIGIKTDLPNPGINWKALDSNKQEIQSGKTIPGELTKPIPISENPNPGILSNSVFRIIPEKPNAGSSIRITGNDFGPSQQFEFFIDANKIGTFQTDANGFFITTMKIPENQPQNRSDFIVRDSEGNENKISIRIGTLGTNIPVSQNVQLSITGVPQVIEIGEIVQVSGTATPNAAITATITNPDNEIINTRTAQVDAKGNWKLEPILIPLDQKLGRYNAQITDGRETISKSWLIESSKKITIVPVKVKFDPGEKIKFNGTATPNIPLDLSLVDPLGVERFADIIQVDKSGIVSFEYPTTANVDKEGTWTLTAIQANEKEHIFAGLGEIPTVPIDIKFDKLNYRSTETAVISLTGQPSDLVSLLIIDQADKPKGDAINITLGKDGKSTYSLSVKGYSSGIYTAIITKGNSQSKEVFAVGLQIGSGDINISTTKLEYKPNDPILILGDTNPNSIITFSLIDLEGKKVKEIETFSDKNGKISEGGFRIPSKATPGIWKIYAKSGSNFKTIELEVRASEETGMVVTTTEGKVIPISIGKSIDIKVINARQTVQMVIKGPDGKKVGELAFPASSSGEIKTPWQIPSGSIPGTYTLSVQDAYHNATTTFQVK